MGAGAAESDGDSPAASNDGGGGHEDNSHSAVKEPGKRKASGVGTRNWLAIATGKASVEVRGGLTNVNLVDYATA